MTPGTISRTPDFAGFLTFRESLLRAGGTILDRSDNRFARALARFRPAGLELPDRAHRCHLAEDWVRVHGLPEARHRNALASAGVRASLSALFEWFSGRGLSLAIPADVYPVYGQLAAAAGIATSTYPSYPAIEADIYAAADVLLVCDPAKPRGEMLSENEVAGIEAWLAADRTRRVVVDNVYAMSLTPSANAERLYATGQAWILGSLSKTWAEPLVLGMAMAPEADLDAGVKDCFAKLPVDREALRKAHAILRHDLDFPGRLRQVLADAGGRLHAELDGLDIGILEPVKPVPRYLFAVEGNYLDILARTGVLGLPFSVFGSDRDDVTVMSSLGLFAAVGGFPRRHTIPASLTRI